MRMRNNTRPETSPITTNIFCIFFAYCFTRFIFPSPMVFPITIEAEDAAPTAMDFTIRKIVDATLLAAMAADVI